MANRTDIKEKDLHELLEIFGQKSFETASASPEDQSILTLCENLMKLDYSIIELDNTGGHLCPQYPPRILIPESEHSQRAQSSAVNPPLDNTKNGTNNAPNSNNGDDSCDGSPMQQPQQHGIIYEDNCDISRIRLMASMSKNARCRTRFVAPVIMFKGKYICRSATISEIGETFINTVQDTFRKTLEPPIIDEENNDEESLEQPSLFALGQAFQWDIQLLNELNVSNIVDLMVENHKCKYLLNVSSSEKADPANRYGNFNIFALPYPGCEFFKTYRDKNCIAKDLIYDWTANFNDAPLNVPELASISDIDINWDEYKQWDLVQLTQNYLKVTLRCIREEKSGTLIHCISGWDRTPLFISLVRLSLWADGLIHKSLNAMQITYLTLAYDWYLFGHQFPSRQKSRENILFFCFDIMKQISGNEFNISENSDDVLMFEPDINISELLNGRSTTCDIDITDNHFATTTTSASLANETSVPMASAVDETDSSAITSTTTKALEITPKSTNHVFDNGSPFSTFSEMSFNANYSPAQSPNPTPSPISNPSPICNASPNSKRSVTTPIKVPSRQRTDSCNSFLVIDKCGSVESNYQFSCSSINGNSLAERTKLQKITKPQITLRKHKLNQVRAIFFNVYSKAIGMPIEAQTSVTSFITAMF